jgi:hypothetical protein
MPCALRPDCPNKRHFHAISGPPSILSAVQPIVYPCLPARLGRIIATVKRSKQARIPIVASVTALGTPATAEERPTSDYLAVNSVD